MSTVIVKRPQRRAAPDMPDGELLMDPLPELPGPGGRSWVQIMTIVPMLAGSGAMALMMGGRGGGMLTYVTGGMFAASMLGVVVAQVLTQSGQPSKRELIAERREYMRRLAQKRRVVRRAIRRQREAMYYRHPDPSRLWSTVSSFRLWERRPADSDFGVVRLALGPQQVALNLVFPDNRPVDQLEPVCTAALKRFLDTYSVVQDLPVAVALRGFARLYLDGAPDRARAMARAILAQAATFHSPDDLLIAVCTSEENLTHWDWLKWLPHALHPERYDGAGQVRLVGTTLAGLEELLDDVIGSRPRFTGGDFAVDGQHVVVVLDGGDPIGSTHLSTEGGVDGVTILDLHQRPPRVLDRSALVLTTAESGTVTSVSMDGSDEVGRADGLPPAEAEALARRLAPLRPSALATGDQPMTAELGLAELLELGDPFDVDVSRTWASRPERDRLRVPLGLGPDGIPVDLDIKESAQDGMGPHGLLVGATGSGKSELLRTLVLALAVTHSSSILNFVLIDFKGGATFTRLDGLPHTSAVITNLEEELALVDRMLDAIGGELVRRQELLRSAGNYASVRDYERAREAGAPLDPLPSLLIICDEFSELLTAKPEFVDMFVQIGRVGRSLGVHLLLASQRLEEGRLRGLETHLSYRIGLRTFSAMESRVAIGVPDAYELPRSPGHGYLRFGTEEPIRFKGAYVSGVYRRSVDGRPVGAGSSRAAVLPYATGYLEPVEPEEPPAITEVPADDPLGETLLDILTDRMRGQGAPAHQVWLPPLGEPVTLDALMPEIAVRADRGLGVEQRDLPGRLQAVVGIVDLPYEQRRDPLWVDLAGSGGHLAVVGGPRSGKSTLLRSLLCSLALGHTPREVQFYCLDFGGGSLASLRDLPHVGGVASRLDGDQVRRTVAELTTLLAERERRFADHGVESMDAYRRLKAEGQFAEDPFTDVFLVVDNWLILRNEFEELEEAVTDLANRGLGFGIHVVTAANRWMDLRMAVRDLFETTVELRLGDPSDSSFNRKLAANVPKGSPGRGLTSRGKHFLGALPRVDGRSDVESLSAGTKDLVDRARAAWSGPPAPRVRLLPPVLRFQDLPAPDPTAPARVPIGIAEHDLRPVHLDMASEPHFLLFGDVESGKSAFLRAFARGVTDRYPPQRARIITVDYRRSLLGSVAPGHLLGSGSSAAATMDLVDQVATVMKERLPGPDVTAEQLRNRSWWSGPELFVLVDDYDLVANATPNPLLSLVEFAAQGRDIGLHLVVTRRAGGAGRAMYDPLLSQLRELASPGLMMSGPREEGPLLGDLRPQLLPPGRGFLVSRRHPPRLIQIAWLDPPT
ncbi:MAG: type VII secretion protein EccCa [Actinocatenispora sp.]